MGLTAFFCAKTTEQRLIWVPDLPPSPALRDAHPQGSLWVLASSSSEMPFSFWLHPRGLGRENPMCSRPVAVVFGHLLSACCALGTTLDSLYFISQQPYQAGAPYHLLVCPLHLDSTLHRPLEIFSIIEEPAMSTDFSNLFLPALQSWQHGYFIGRHGLFFFSGKFLGGIDHTTESETGLEVMLDIILSTPHLQMRKRESVQVENVFYCVPHDFLHWVSTQKMLNKSHAPLFGSSMAPAFITKSVGQTFAQCSF